MARLASLVNRLGLHLSKFRFDFLWRGLAWVDIRHTIVKDDVHRCRPESAV